MVLAAFIEKGLLPPKEVAHLRVLHIAGLIIVYEAFIGMEPHVDSFQQVFSERALLERKTLGTMPVGGFALWLLRLASS